jgi:hypothetical protein
MQERCVEEGGRGWAIIVDIQAVSWHRRVWRGFGGTLNGTTTKGYGIRSLRGGSFINPGARFIDCVGTT